MPGRSSAEEMPRLDAFDQEFGREPVAIVRGQRRKRSVWSSALVCIALGAGIIGALALSWPYGDGPLRFELQSAPLFQRSATREDSDEQIDRLRREVDALKKEISELNEAQRQADETIATLKEDPLNGTSPNGIPSAYWYSNLAALHFKVARSAEPRVAVPPSGAPESRDATSSIQPESRVATPAPRRVRREPREPARGVNGGNGAVPLSLEAPQQ
jgi:hypothetical protein